MERESSLQKLRDKREKKQQRILNFKMNKVVMGVYVTVSSIVIDERDMLRNRTGDEYMKYNVRTQKFLNSRARIYKYC